MHIVWYRILKYFGGLAFMFNPSDAASIDAPNISSVCSWVLLIQSGKRTREYSEGDRVAPPWHHSLLHYGSIFLWLR